MRFLAGPCRRRAFDRPRDARRRRGDREGRLPAASFCWSTATVSIGLLPSVRAVRARFHINSQALLDTSKASQWVRARCTANALRVRCQPSHAGSCSDRADGDRKAYSPIDPRDIAAAYARGAWNRRKPTWTLATRRGRRDIDGRSIGTLLYNVHREAKAAGAAPRGGTARTPIRDGGARHITRRAIVVAGGSVDQGRLGGGRAAAVAEIAT